MVRVPSSTGGGVPPKRDPVPYLRLRRRPGRSPRYIIHHGTLSISTGTSNKAEALKQFAAFMQGISRPKKTGFGLQTRLVDLLPLHSAKRGKGQTEERKSIYRRKYLRLSQILGDKEIREIDEALCKSYIAMRQAPMANGCSIGPDTIRAELELLKAVIKDFCAEHRIDWTPTIFMPPKQGPRAIFATRSEFASLLRAVRRQRSKAKRLVAEVQSDQSVIRRKVLEPEIADAIARFLLIALYTGTRRGAILKAGWTPHPQRGHFDLEEQRFYRKGSKEPISNKRRTPVRLCPRLLAHLRRWKASDARRGHGLVIHDAVGRSLAFYVVEWRMRRARRSAGIKKNLTPHAIRHTTGTWMLEGGASLGAVAKALGITIAELERTYGEWDAEFSVAASEALVHWGR